MFFKLFNSVFVQKTFTLKHCIWKKCVCYGFETPAFDLNWFQEFGWQDKKN